MICAIVFNTQTDRFRPVILLAQLSGTLLDGVFQQVVNSGCGANHLQVGAHHTTHKEVGPGSS